MTFLHNNNSKPVLSSSTLSSNALLKQLPRGWHMQFKTRHLNFKALHTGRPPYLTDI